jgi:hypothetical protein
MVCGCFGGLTGISSAGCSSSRYLVGPVDEVGEGCAGAEDEHRQAGHEHHEATARLSRRP